MINWDDVFEYRDGVLYWKDRPAHNFTSHRAYRSWFCRFCGKKAGYVERASGGLQDYLRVRFQGRQYFVHRIVWEMFHGALDRAMWIDHIDGDGLNNSIGNLRTVTSKQSAENRPMPKTNTSGILGVCFNRKHKRWQATIGRIRLGSFKTFEEAVNARKNAEKIYDYHVNHGRRGRVCS